MMIWAGYVAGVGGGWYRLKPKGTGWCAVDWIHLAEDRERWRGVVNTAMNTLVI
jgi:hypothetical protein